VKRRKPVDEPHFRLRGKSDGLIYELHGTEVRIVPEVPPRFRWLASLRSSVRRLLVRKPK
jgi:hypothetical protein